MVGDLYTKKKLRMCKFASLSPGACLSNLVKSAKMQYKNTTTPVEGT